MLHIDFKKWSCPFSLILQFSCQFQKSHIYHFDLRRKLYCVTYFFLMLLDSMSHINFKKWQEMARNGNAKFRGQEPYPFSYEDTLKALFFFLRQR